MRFLSLDMVKPGLSLARTLYDEQGRVLLKSGVELKQEYLERFKKIGLTGVYVRDEFTDSLDLVDIVSEKTYMETYKALREILQGATQSSDIQSREVMDSVKNIIDEIISNRKHLITVNDLRLKGNYAFSHGVSVCITAVRMGLALGYDELKLKQLALGALLHDLGKAKIDQKLLDKPHPTPEEQYMIRQHTQEGFELMRRNGEFSILSAHVAYQHHEKFDGTGYPRGLRGTEITEFARIVAVCNTYDHLTHDRPGQARLMPYEAINKMSEKMSGYFDPDMLELLVRTVAIYPVGAQVKLYSGEVGIVVRNYRDFPTQPALRILKNADGSPIDIEVEYELAQCKDKFIAAIIQV